MAQVFFCEFYKISKKTFFAEHLWATTSANPCDLMFNIFAEWQKLYVSWLYVSIDRVLFVSFISVDLLILNSRGIKYKVGNFHLLKGKNLIQNLLHRYLKENTIEEASLILQDMYRNKRDLSIRYLKHYSAKHGI